MPTWPMHKPPQNPTAVTDNPAKLSQSDLREFLARKGLMSVPRLLSFEDRMPLSKFKGSFDREFWNSKSTDFPNGLRQLAVHPLALAWNYEAPFNPFYKSEQLLRWIGDGLEYTATIQGPDGSWDEFYPNEKGFGATALVVWGGLSALKIVGADLNPGVRDRALESMSKGAHCIGRHRKKIGFLANHYTFALAALHRSMQLIDENEFQQYYDEKLEILDSLYEDEGWHIEYDGLDVGYQSTTVSFLGKIYRDTGDPELKRRVEKVCELLTHFFYPNGHFAGSIGSRQTLHAYLHGLEIFSGEIPAAAALVDRIERALAAGLIIHPETQADRYVHYRVEDFLLTATDFNETKDLSYRLPFERKGDYDADFPKAGMIVRKREKYYLVSSFARGGVTKVFELPTGKLLLSDPGVLLRTKDNKLLSTQWIGEERHETSDDGEITYASSLKQIGEPSFNPIKFILFRAFLSTLARSPMISNEFKAFVRQVLMLKSTKSTAEQRRTLKLSKDSIHMEVEINLLDDSLTPSGLVFGGEWFTRYVPQSKYFQYQELDTSERALLPSELDSFATERCARWVVDITPGKINSFKSEVVFPTEKRDRIHTTDLVEQFRDWQQGKSTYLWKRRCEAVLDQLPTSGVVLDAGCGDMSAIDYFKTARPQLSFASCDLSQLTGDDFVRADVQELPYENNSFDAVVLLAVIEHVPSHKKTMNEIKRVLKPEGLAIITTPNPLYGIPMALAGRIGLKYKEGYDNGVSLEELQRVAQDTGFEVHRKTGFLMLPFSNPLESYERVLAANPTGRKMLMNQLISLKKPITK